jgi:hypothetical protein
VRSSCRSKWDLYLLTSVDINDKVHQEEFAFKDVCLHRDCPYCMRERVSRARRSLKPSFDAMRRPDGKVSHVTLTFGKHREMPSEGFKGMMQQEIINMMKRLNTKYDSELGREVYKQRYNGVVLYEFKKQADGLFHCHCHIAFERSPHHLALYKVWNAKRSSGESWRVHVKYNASKKAVLNYFARRVALSGMEYDDSVKSFHSLPEYQYRILVHGTRLWSSFGSSIFIVWGRNSSETQDYFSTSCLVRRKSVCGVPRDVDDPPPELLDLTDVS